MTILLILAPLALMLGLTGLGAFVWSLKAGQYDDLDGSALRILLDDDLAGEPPARDPGPGREQAACGGGGRGPAPEA